MGGTGGHYAKWNKPGGEGQIPYDLTFNWNIINKRKKQTKYYKHVLNKGLTTRAPLNSHHQPFMSSASPLHRHSQTSGHSAVSAENVGAGCRRHFLGFFPLGNISILVDFS